MDYLHLNGNDHRTPEEKVARGKKGILILAVMTAIALLLTPGIFTKMKKERRNPEDAVTEHMDSVLTGLLDKCGCAKMKVSYTSRPEYGTFMPMSPLEDSLLITRFKNPEDTALISSLEEQIMEYRSDEDNMKRYYQRTVVLVDKYGIDYSAVQIYPLDGAKDSLMRCPQPNGVIDLTEQYGKMKDAIKQKKEMSDKEQMIEDMAKEMQLQEMADEMK